MIVSEIQLFTIAFGAVHHIQSAVEISILLKDDLTEAPLEEGVLMLKHDAYARNQEAKV